jgi:hypothetical protein
LGRLADGKGELVEVVAEPPPTVEDAMVRRAEARRHYEQAIAGGLAAPAEVGLAILAREEGRHEDAGHHLAAARRSADAMPPLRADLVLGPSLGRP